MDQPKFTLRQLRYFRAAAETGSIKQAAHRLNAAEATLSAAIAQLEAILGIALFVRRHAQGLALTTAGARLLREAETLLDRAGAFEHSARVLREEVAGRLDLGCLSTIAPVILAPAARHFLSRHPEVDLRFHEHDQAGLLIALADGVLDLAITYDLQLDASTRFEPFVELPPYVLLPVGHPHAGDGAVSLRELSGEPLVLLDLPLSRDYLLGLFDSLDVRPQVGHRTSQPDFLRSLVANGFGYGLFNIVPSRLVAMDGAPYVVRPIREPLRPMRLGFARHAGVTSTRLSAIFGEELRGFWQTAGGSIKSIQSFV